MKLKRIKQANYSKSDQSLKDKIDELIDINPYLGNVQKTQLKSDITPAINNLGNDDYFIELIRTILLNRKLCDNNVFTVLKDALNLYPRFVTIGATFSQFLKLFEYNGIYDNNLFSEEVISNFETLEKYFQAMNIIINHDIALKNWEYTKKLITNLGIYTANDVELISMISYFLTNSNFAENYGDLVEVVIDNAKKRVGIYDNLSDKYLANLEALVNKSFKAIDAYKSEEEKFEKLKESLKLIRTEAEKSQKAFGESVKQIDNDLLKIAAKYSNSLESIYTDLFAKLKKDYLDLSQGLSQTAATEAKKAALAAVSDLENAAKELTQVKEEYTLQTEDMEKLKKAATEEVHKGLKEMRSFFESLGVDENVDLTKLSALLSNLPTSSNILVPSQTVVTPSSGIIIPDNQIEAPVPTIIKEFDETRDFNMRYREVMDKKAKLESEGVVYNEVIDACIYFILRNFYPYLYGPSGAGKNYFVKQLATLFDLPCLDIGYITEEFDIVGGTNAYGNYSPTNFYQCWRNGYLGFANEFDNSIASAAVKLNTFLDKESGEEYFFRGTVSAKRHPNFRLIAAGNTTGMGANRAYNARQKFDEAIQQRFKYIKFDFDPKVEKSILKNHNEWYEFAKLFREALKESWRFQEDELEGQITTRDLRDLVFEIEDNILSEEEILQYEFIEAKDDDRLASINQYMKKNSSSVPEGTKKLIMKFNNIVEAKKGSE